MTILSKIERRKEIIRIFKESFGPVAHGISYSNLFNTKLNVIEIFLTFAPNESTDFEKITFIFYDEPNKMYSWIHGKENMLKLEKCKSMEEFSKYANQSAEIIEVIKEICNHREINVMTVDRTTFSEN